MKAPFALPGTKLAEEFSTPKATGNKVAKGVDEPEARNQTVSEEERELYEPTLEGFLPPVCSIVHCEPDTSTLEMNMSGSLTKVYITRGGVWIPASRGRLID